MLTKGCAIEKGYTSGYVGPTISSEKERYEMVRQCKWVDEVYEGAPWNLTEGIHFK